MRLYVAFFAASFLSMVTSAMAHGVNIYAEALANYEHVKYGSQISQELKDLRVVAVSSVAIPCPAGTACRRPGRAFLVGFAEGDGGGQALEFRKVDATCSDCITSVATAGGGALDRRGLMSFGLTAAQANVLLAPYR
jgi:hypothetical protein